MEALRDSIHAVHKKATEAASSPRASKREQSTHARAATAANFDIGDFVLVARRETNSGEKLTLRWRGPNRIVDTLSDHVYEVQDLGSRIFTPVHCTRLRYYLDPSLDITADLRDQIAHNNQGYDVQVLKYMRYDSSTQQYQILVSWLGFEPTDQTWKPIATIHEDVPELLRVFLFKHKDRALATRAHETIA
jgi:hypothetical protein